MPDDPNKVPADTTPTAVQEAKAERAFFGRKFALVFLILVAFTVIVYLKSDITGKDAVDTLIWLAAIGTGSIALEDGIGKLRGK